MTAGVRMLQDVIPEALKTAPVRRVGTFTWQDYNCEKQEFIRAHPDATAAEIEQECQRIAFEMGL